MLTMTDRLNLFFGPCFDLIEINGTYAAANVDSQHMLGRCGLNPDSHFLDYDLLLAHVSDYGYSLSTEEKN